MKKQIGIGVILVLFLVTGAFVFWKKQIGSQNTQQKTNKTEVFVDVRTDEEWQAGHLNNAIHLDLSKIQQGQLPDLSKDTPVAIYCRSGNRAGQALKIFQQNGFTNVRNAGGLAELQSSGNKVCLGVQSSCN